MSHHDLARATQHRARCEGLRARRQPLQPKENWGKLSGTHVDLHLVPFRGGEIEARVHVRADSLHIAPKDAWGEALHFLRLVKEEWARTTGTSVQADPELRELHLHVDVVGVEVEARWKLALNARCPSIPFGTLDRPKEHRQGLANEIFHIYDKFRQAQVRRRARYILDVWRAEGWDGRGPGTRFEAVLKHKALKQLGILRPGDIDLNDIWQRVLDRIGAAGSRNARWTSIRGFPSRILRSARFVAPWDSPPGIVRPRRFSHADRLAQAWGSYRHYTTELAAMLGLPRGSFREVARRLGVLYAERDAGFDQSFHVEVGSRRAQLALPPLKSTRTNRLRGRIVLLPASSFEAYHERFEDHGAA